MRSTDTGRTMGKGNYCSLRRCKGPSSRRGGLEVLGHTGLIQCCLLFTTCWPRLCSPFWPGLKDPGHIGGTSNKGRSTECGTLLALCKRGRAW